MAKEGEKELKYLQEAPPQVRLPKQFQPLALKD